MFMFKWTLYCVSVTAENLNLYQRYIYKDEDVNTFLGTHYFVVLDSTLGAW